MSSLPLYPLKFKPIYKEKIWGGSKINSILGKDFAPLKNCGESWELSGVKGDVSIVANGTLEGQPLDSLIARYPKEILGENFKGKEFPLLIKFLDASDDLSIQVHPNDELAQKKHGGKGKTEMWYIIDAEPEAKMYVGFKERMEKEQFLEIGGNSEILDHICTESVSYGDVFYVPAGRIHSIGKGVLLAEIQQTSDFTYRIYDFERKDNAGNLRELHLDDAVEALDFKDTGETFKTNYDRNSEYTPLVESKYFNTWRLLGQHQLSINSKENKSFRIYIIIDGAGSMRWSNQNMSLKKGDVFLIPASLPSIEIKTEKSFHGLEVFLA